MSKAKLQGIFDADVEIETENQKEMADYDKRPESVGSGVSPHNSCHGPHGHFYKYIALYYIIFNKILYYYREIML